MAKFPETNPTPNYPLALIPKWRTIVTPMESGKEQRRSAWTYPQWDVTVSYSAIESSNAQNLYDFYMARKGSYEAFHIYDLSLHRFSRTHTALFVANGDSTTLTFDLPGRSVTNETIYIDGSSQSSAADYTISTTSGDSDADQVVFTAAPSTGEVITVTFTGYLRIRARFSQDNLPFELFETNLQRTGSISLIGLAST